MTPQAVSERLKQFLDKKPSIDPAAYIHSRATVIGDVRLAPKTSIWPGAVLRGDVNYIEVGEGSNIQDGSVVHLSFEHPTIIGRYVTIGHLAMIHGCTIEDECLIGMHATILDGAVIGHHSIIGAGAVVTEGMVVPPGSMVLGCPGKITRTLDAERQNSLKAWADKYVYLSAEFKSRGI